MLDLHFSYGATRWLRGAAAAAIASALVAAPAFAAIPKTSLIDGVLTSSGGSAAADGDYDIVFAIYDAASGGNTTWTETAKVKVTGGRFSHALGSVAALDQTKLIAANAHWLGLKVGSDPELPRQALHASLFSQVAGQALALTCDGCVGSNQLSNGGVAAAKVGFNYAGSSTKGGPAIDVDCTGCVDVSDIKFNGDVDLGANSLKSKNGTFSGDVTAATVTATSFVGDGSKLTGIKTPSGECKTAGEVVKGINADGSLKCIAALDPAALPKDGLNEISNDLLSNKFIDTITGEKNIPIPDKTGTDAISNLVFPDICTTQSFDVYVEVANTDLSAVSMTPAAGRQEDRLGALRSLRREGRQELQGHVRCERGPAVGRPREVDRREPQGHLEPQGPRQRVLHPAADRQRRALRYGQAVRRLDSDLVDQDQDALE